MSGLTLQLLGPPSASVSRAPPGPGMGAAKNLALLAYLALEPGSHSRESLAALLWGESPEQAARASLRQALRRLRAAVGDDLRIGHGTVELRGPVECDVTAFLATAHEHPERAAGFDVPRTARAGYRRAARGGGGRAGAADRIRGTRRAAHAAGGARNTRAVVPGEPRRAGWTVARLGGDLACGGGRERARHAARRGGGRRQDPARRRIPALGPRRGRDRAARPRLRCGDRDPVWAGGGGTAWRARSPRARRGRAPRAHRSASPRARAAAALPHPP